MKWSPEDAYKSINEWARKEITDTTDRLQDLSKFLLGVSVSSIVAFVAISRLSGVIAVNISFAISIIMYLLSIFLILNVLLRDKNDFNEKTDLHSEFMSDLEYVKKRVWHWFCLWLAGLLFSGYTLYY